MNNNELNNQTDNLETQNTDDDSTVTDDLEDMIEQLPENFPQALPIIQNEIAPIIAECDPGLIKQKHFYSPKARLTLSAPFTAPFFLPSILRFSSEESSSLRRFHAVKNDCPTRLPTGKWGYPP